ncbi:MAG: sensor histidine kinase [Chitinophagaceae bacterium]|nr:sensor histidine kinase [Chitinophagaceae bacterium]MDB5224267.1 sensor histidine kinase [Chitinophagaceae bacterium]
MLTQNQIKILIIDDDEDDYFIISDYINEIDKTKFIIDWCNSYQSAIEKFKLNYYDIYFVDYRLGNETGLELLKEAIRLHCEEPIILLTGKGNKAIDIEAMKAGATDYLIKSELNTEKLERCIRYSLDRAASLKTIKQSEKRLKTFFQSGPDAVVVINEHQQILEWNPKAEAIFGFAVNEVIGKRLSETIIPNQYREAHEKGMFHFLKTGEGPVLNKTIEITALHKKGHEFYINLSVSNVKLKGEWLFIAFLSDITERKKTEEALIHKEAELLQAKLLEEKKDEFISIASHELKTPLTTIKAYAQLALALSKECSPGPVEQYLSKVDQYAVKLTSLINELLDVSKINAGKLRLSQTEVETGSFLPEILNSMQQITQNHTIILEENESAKVKIDTLRLEQVITNIISNASKYSPGKDKIIVNAVKNSSDIIVSFKDFGIGIPKEKISKIFDRFYRVDEVSKDFSGLGIGLFISSEIIKQHGGKIWAESTEGEGSTFYFSIPVINSK